MSNTDKGVLVFDEWFDAMSKLNPKEYKLLMEAIHRYQLHGEEPPEFKGKTALVAYIIFPYIRRRLSSAKGGKKAIASRHPAYGINPYIDEIIERQAAKELGE